MTEPAKSVGTRPLATLDETHCPECGYSLRGLSEASARCPECGEPLGALRSQAPTLPWARARGFFTAYLAYWRTVWLVMLQGRRFRAELARPVSYRAAQWFRVLSILHVTPLPPLALVVGAMADAQFALETVREFPRWVLITVTACWVLWVSAATGVPSYFFHPRYLPLSRQNRAVALSYYTLAPLALTPLSLLLLVASLLLAPVPGGRRELVEVIADICVLLAGFGIPVGVLIIWWLSLIHLARAALQSNGRVVLMAILTPVLSLLLAGVIFAVLPMSVMYGYMLYQALRL